MKINWPWGQLSRSCQTGLSKEDLQKWHRTFEGHWIPWMEMQDSSPLRSPHWRQKVERRSNYSAGWQHISHHLMLLYPRGYLEKVTRRKHRVCPRVCLTEAPPNKPNEYGPITAQFKRRRATRYNKKAPAQNTWVFLSVDGLTFPQRLQQRRQVFLRKTLMQRQQLLIRCLALPCRTQVHNLLQPLLQRR